jgi:signal transduction histidine kinase
MHRNDYDRALQYAEESLEQANILKAANLYINAGKILSDIYLAQKRYPEAEAEAFKAWLIDTTNIDESRALINNIALANIYMGNTEKAAHYLNKYSALNAQYTEKSFHTTVSDLSILYETEKKVERIASLEKERRLYVWLGVVGALLAAALAIMLLLTIWNARKKQQLIANEALQEGEIGERARIAQDLHDRLGSSLAAVTIGLKNAESLQVVGNKIDICVKELREITNNIMPRSLQQFGMKGELEDFSAQFSNLYFHFFGEAKRISHSQEYAVYCCARELVNNALKHSGATVINLQLIQSKKHVSLTVQDDGCGFDEKTVKKGDGLHNLRNRVAASKGRIDITTASGKGTETVIELKVES